MIRNYIRKYKYSYLIGMLILLAVDYLGLYIPQFTGEVTDGLLGGMGMKEVLRMIGRILLVGAGMALGRFGWRYFIFGAARKIEYELRGEMFRHLSGLSMRYYNEHKTGDLMAHFTNDLGAIRMSMGPAVISTFDAIVMTVMVIAKMILHVSFSLTLLACIPMLFILAGGIYYGRTAERRYDEKQKAFSDMTDQVQESISGVVKLQAIVMPMLDVIIGIASVITLFYGGNLVLRGEITAGQFVAFSSYVNMLVWPMLAVGDSINSFSQGFASMKRVEAIFREEPEIVDGPAAAGGPEQLRGRISVRGLSFSYQEQEGDAKDASLPALTGLSLEIAEGETLAIIGRTGSGKTTFANLGTVCVPSRYRYCGNPSLMCRRTISCFQTHSSPILPSACGGCRMCPRKCSGRARRPRGFSCRTSSGWRNIWNRISSGRKAVLTRRTMIWSR